MTAVQVAADEDVQAGAGATAGLFAELQGHAVGGDDVVASDDAFLLDTQDLLELMIVVAIIGILAAIAIPVYSGVTRKARVAKANADLNVLASAVSVYAAFANALPSTLALGALNAAQPRANPGQQLQDDFRQYFVGLMAYVGPQAWFPWTLGFRNMLAHRARRLEVNQLRPNHSLYGWDGRPIIRTEVIHHLARDPSLSDIEAPLHRAGGTLTLTEPGETTLAGVLASTLRLAEGSAVQLLAAWNARKEAPNLLHQPQEQWPGGPAQPAFDFVGYAPGSAPANPGMFIGGPDMPPRLLAAALDDARRQLWATFD